MIPTSARAATVSRPMRWLPRSLPLILGVLGIGWGLHYLIQRETPIGKVQGQILLSDMHKPLAGVRIVLQPTDDDRFTHRLRHAVTDEQGRFTITNVPEGEYDVSATSRAHDARDSKLNIMEGRTTQITLNLQRTEADLQIKRHQSVYGSKEKAHLSVTGYVDGDKALAMPAQKDTMRVRVFRTRLSNVLNDPAAASALEQVGRSYDPTPELPKSLMHPAGAPAPQPVSQQDIVLNTADREGFFYQKLNFDLPTGLYLLDVTHQKKTVSSWLLVTDTALVVKRAKSQLMAFAVDMQSGSPVGDAEIKTFRNGKVVAQSRTDGRGLAQLSVPGLAESDEAASTRVTTVAIRGNDEAVVQRDSYRNEDGKDYTVHAYTDRPVYRPGQRIQFKGIVRRKHGSNSNAVLSLSAAPDPAPRRYDVPARVPVDVEIRDRTGERVLQQRYTCNRYGAFFGQVDLLKEAPTGVYTMLMKMGEEEHTEDIYVASYRKPEFAVTVASDKKRYTRGELVTMTIDGQYYFGAPVAGAKVRYSVYQSPDWAAEYADESDYDPEEDSTPSYRHFHGESYYGSSVQDGTITLNEDGKAIIRFKAERPKRGETDADDRQKDKSEDDTGPQEQVYTLSATVIEGQDREVEATGTARVTAGEFRLTVSPDGYVAAPGQATSVTLSARDFDGKPIPNLPIGLESGYESWKHDTYKYTKSGLQNVVTGADGRVIVPVTPPKNGTLQLKARTKDAGGHAILGNASLWVTSDQGGDLDTTYEDLSLLTDRRQYKPGETARVLINASHLGQTVLLTVEGERVHRVETLPIRTRSTVVRVPILPQYGPNVFLSACYVQNKHFATSETPLRVIMPQTELKVTVRADREAGAKAIERESASVPPSSSPQLARYQPGDRITYHVLTTDTAGRPTPCELSFGVVDEAIYALREDDPKALRNAFYPRRYNGVSTIYSFAVEYLGDADKAEPKIETRKRFPDTAYWNPTLQTDARGEATVSFALPDNLTTWRATAVAHTLETLVGRGTDKVMVAKDFFVRLQTPRTLTQKDTSRLVAIVHNETDAPQTALVRLQAENLTTSGDSTQTLTLPPGKTGEAVWPVTAEGIGEAKLKVTAWTAKAANGAQFTDGLETTLPIRPHGREQLTTFAGELTGAQPETEVLRLDPNAVPGVSSMTVRITPSVASALTGGVDYLIGYPYGCVEQTLSRVLPDLLVQRTLKLHGISDVKRQEELPRMVREGLQRLYKFQHASGAWGWWEHDEDDPWMTGYVLVGLATAKAQGYPVSGSVLKQGVAAGAKLIKRAKPNEKPFLLYGLAMAGEKTAVKEERRRLILIQMEAEDLAYVVLTDRLLGESGAEAQRLLDKHLVSENGGLHWKQGTGYDRDSLTATAMGLRAMIAANPRDERIGSVLRWLMLKRTDSYWGNTRDTSWVLSAFCDYLTAQPGYSSGGQVNVQVNGKPLQSFVLSENNQTEKELALRVPSTALRAGKNDVTLTRLAGSSPIFYTVQLRQTVASEDMPAVSATKIDVQREYLRVSAKQNSSTPWTLRTEPTHNLLQTGDHIHVRLTLNVPHDMAYVLIEDPFPAGCEVSERGDAGEVTDWSYWWSSVDVRDDKIAFFARSLSKGQHIIEYNLRAQIPGSYHVLPAFLQAMYAPDDKAESAETRVEIK